MKLTLISRVFMLCFLLIGTGFSLQAQQDKSKRPSPPDVVTQKIGEASITLDYSQPGLKGRKLETLAPAGKVWRTGANECTSFETSADLTINGEKLAAGKYSLFTVPGEKEWTFIFNEDYKQWGAYNYSKDKDVLRVTTPVQKAKETMERLTFTIGENDVTLQWGDVAVGMEVGSEVEK